MSADSDSDADVAPTERHREGSADDAEVKPVSKHADYVRLSKCVAGAQLHVYIAYAEAEQARNGC